MPTDVEDPGTDTGEADASADDETEDGELIFDSEEVVAEFEDENSQ